MSNCVLFLRTPYVWASPELFFDAIAATASRMDLTAPARVVPRPAAVNLNAASASRDFRRARTRSPVSGCAPPNTRRAIRTMSSSVVTASRRSSSVAPVFTISCVTPYASRRGVGQWGGAGGACCEDHLAYCDGYWVFARRGVVASGALVTYRTLANLAEAKNCCNARTTGASMLAASFYDSRHP